MASKYCSSCTQKRLLSSFFSDTSNPGSKVLATCNICRAHKTRHNKRKALQPLDPNVPAKRQPTKAPTRPNPSILPPNPAKSRPKATIPPPNPPESRLEATKTNGRHDYTTPKATWGFGGVRRAKALTGWETRRERRLLPLLPRPLIYSSCGPRGFGGWPPR